MLKEWPTRCTLPVQDLPRARTFYEQILGLVAIEEFPDGGVNYNASGTRITLFPSRTSPVGDHSQLGFDVQDIRAVINSLESKGVRFEDYDMPGFTTDGHLVNIAPYNCAWFKDSEGNSLAIWEPDSAPAGRGILAFRDCSTEANLPANNMQRARRFYEERLGFKALEVFADGGVAYEAGSTQFLVSPTTVTPSREHTLIAFDVGDIHAEMHLLEAVGVVFEAQSVGPPTVAWFRDSEGNLLSLAEGIRTPATSGA